MRTRILEPIVRECRHAAGLAEADPTEAEIAFAWLIHGGIYYWGVRSVVYETAPWDNRGFVLGSAMDSLIAGLPGVRDGDGPVLPDAAWS